MLALRYLFLFMSGYQQNQQSTKEAKRLTAEDTESTKTEIATPRIVARVATSLGFIAEDYPRAFMVGRNYPLRSPDYRIIVEILPQQKPLANREHFPCRPVSCYTLIFTITFSQERFYKLSRLQTTK